MGYFRGLTHGAIIGAALGILYAPEAGVEMRRRVSRLLGQPAQPIPGDTAAAPVSPAAPRRRNAGASEPRTRRP